MRRRVSICLVGGLVALSVGPGARADNDKASERSSSFEASLDPALDPEILITDDMEESVSAGETCVFQNALTGAPSSPSSGSFVLIYGRPSDTSVNDKLDRPRDCNDGAIKRSVLHRSARNLAVFHNNENAGLENRHLKRTDTHAFTGASYESRMVRRFQSSDSASTWNNRKLYDFSTGTTPRLDAWRDELHANGWDISNVKYFSLLVSKAQQHNCQDSDPTTTCYIYGNAKIGGKHGISVRTIDHGTTSSKIRYGCGTRGDVILAHELTHLLDVVPQSGDHVTDGVNDLMYPYWGGRRFIDSPPIRWDVNDNDYFQAAIDHAYTINSEFGDSDYSTC